MTDKEKDETNEQENFNDMYDVVHAVIDVKSEHDTLNSDFTLANLRTEIFQNEAIVYIKDHINIMVAINNYLDIKETEDEPYRKKVQKLLLDEVISITNLSRADQGKVLEAILAYIRGQTGVQIPNEEADKPKGIFGRTVDKIKGKEQ